MEVFLPISYLNDFIFCPYSIYLHQVFDNSENDVYSAIPQQVGKSAHQAIDDILKKQSKNILSGINIISNTLGIYGKIDQYYVNEKILVERKYQLNTIYKGYYYQLWAQCIALEEMGFEVKQLFFHSIKNNKRIEIHKPGVAEIEELKQHIKKIARYDVEAPLKINPEKCKHCIYAALCDKTDLEHVYA